MHESSVADTNTSHGYPATDLIKVLLDLIGVDVSKSAGNAQLSSRFYFILSAYYAALQILIQKVTKSADAEWQSYEQYTVAIPRVERILLDFYLQDLENKALPPSDSVEGAIIFIQKWDSNREMLDRMLADLTDEKLLSLALDIDADFFMKLPSKFDAVCMSVLWQGLSSLDDDFYLAGSWGIVETLEYLVANHEEGRTDDDRVTISVLDAYFHDNPLKDTDITQRRGGKLLSDVKNMLVQMKDCAVSIWMTNTAIIRIVIKTMMLTYIPLALISSEKTSRDWKDHMRSATVWEALKNLVKIVLDHVNSGHTPTLAVVEGEWIKVKDLLLKISITYVDTSGEMVELLRLAAKIRRPLHGRSVELIKMLYSLDIASKRGENTSQRRNLKAIMVESIKSLENAQKAVSDVKTIGLTVEEYKTDLRGVLKKIEPIFASLKLSKEWSEKEKVYYEAVKIDETHFDMMKKRLSIV